MLFLKPIGSFLKCIIGMKIAILILAHKDQPQIEFLIKQLQHPSFNIYLHLDKNASYTYHDIQGNYKRIENNYACSWGGYSVAKATFNLLKKAFDDGNEYFILISGQDFPVKTNEQIFDFFLKNRGKSFIYMISKEQVKVEPLVDYNNFLQRFSLIHVPKRAPKNVFEKIGFSFKSRWRQLQKKYSFLRFPMPANIYAGENWFNLHRVEVAHLLAEYHKSIILRFRLSLGLSMEEVLPHTLLNRNLLTKNWVNDSLRFTIWKPNTSHPECLSYENLDEAVSSNELFARKFDDIKVIHQLSEKLKQS
jgi:hypothetical protein